MHDDVSPLPLERSEDELYLDLDRAAFGDGADISPRQVREGIARGRRVFEAWLSDHRDQFCADERVRTLLSAEGSGALSDVGVIVDVIATISDMLPVGSLAALVVRRGLSTVCGVS